MIRTLLTPSELQGAIIDLHLSVQMQKAEVSARPRDPVTRTKADTHPEQKRMLDSMATDTLSSDYQSTSMGSTRINELGNCIA